jgi:3(or 17)beta-hydroxysteroid dehydrogenase
MAINLDSVFLGIKHGAEAMKRSGGGSIVNISSVAGLVGIAEGATAYCASKGGVTLLTRAAALEFALLKSNIRVNSVHPGYMQTPMLEGVINAYREPDAAREVLMKNEPLGRFGQPSDVANAVLYLASDEAAFVTGTQLVVDGGYYAK